MSEKKEAEYVSVRVPRADVIGPRAFGETEQAHIHGLLKKGGIDPLKPFVQEEDKASGDYIYKQDKALLAAPTPPVK